MVKTVISEEERDWRRRAAMTCAEAHVQARGYKRIREMEVLALAAVGHSDEEIAEQLGIKLGTVGVYWKRLLEKLGASTRTEAVAAVCLLEVRRLRKENKELRKSTSP